MTLLFIWPELSDSSFLGISVLKKILKRYWKYQLQRVSNGLKLVLAFQIVKVTVEDWGHRNQSCGVSRSELNVQTKMYRTGLHIPLTGKGGRGPSGNPCAVYWFIIYLWCIWTTRIASILLNILYLIFYDSQCLTVNELEIKWSFQNTRNISEIFPARDSSSATDEKGNLWIISPIWTFLENIL